LDPAKPTPADSDSTVTLVAGLIFEAAYTRRAG
jgi:hypothetical protein